MRTTSDNPWSQREQVLQSLYISPSVQHLLPNLLIGDEAIPAELERFIKQYDLPRLANTFDQCWRGAATRFFNLPSARRSIERALRTEYDAITQWLLEETSPRFAFDFFGDKGDPIAGYGVLCNKPTELRFTRTTRMVLQRMAGDTYVLWTAYPLLSPRQPCWMDSYIYASHPPSTPLLPLFYYFLNCYLSVTSIYLGADAVIQGTTDFLMLESTQSFHDLRKAVESLALGNMPPKDQAHLTYELTSRCLDETLPAHYVTQPTVFVEALQHSLNGLARLHTDQPH